MNLLELFVKIVADDQATSRIASIGDNVKSKLGAAAKAGGAAMVAATTAAAAGAAAMGKQALDSYASYEQLAGGVDKLYQESSDKLKKYAQDAYQTAGMSANDYMEQATSFSAALINSLGGDTDKAADQTDKAMRLMSDNVNTFGSNAEDVQNAIKGISRENYTMIDNLKLGYAGTKEGMQQLIADANEYAKSIGQAGDLQMGSFSDAIDAIQLIQEKQHIAGTTAKEAATTIEGALNMTKAAWSNLLAEFGKDDGDVGKRVTELVTSAKTYLLGSVDEATGEVKGGIVPRIREIANNVAEALSQAMPVVIEAVREVVPAVMEVVTTILPSLLQAIVEVIAAIAAEIPSLVLQLVPVIIDLTPRIVEAGLQMFLGIVQALTETGPGLMDKVTEVIFTVANMLVDYAPQILEASLRLFMAIAQALLERLPDIISRLGELLGSVARTIIEFAPDLLMAAAQLFMMIVQAAVESVGAVIEAVAGIGRAILDGIGGFFREVYEAGANLIRGFIQGIADNVAGVGRAIMDGIGGAIEGAKRLLGISSPSKVFAEIGKNTMLGLEGGIEGEMSGLERVVGMVNGALSVDGGMAANAPARAVAGRGDVSVSVYVSGREGEDAWALGRRIGSATAYELRMRGVCA